MKFEPKKLDLYDSQIELISSLSGIDSENIDVDIDDDKYCFVFKDRRNKRHCPFSIIIHLKKEKISFYIDNDITVLNYEDYNLNSDYFEWIKSSIDLFLTSSIVIHTEYYNGNLKKKSCYISNYKDLKMFDYPINSVNGFKWFWQKKKIKIKKDKYASWVVEGFDTHTTNSL